MAQEKDNTGADGGNEKKRAKGVKVGGEANPK